MTHQQENHFEGCQLNERAALDALGGQRELLAELARMFCEDSPDLLDSLQQALLSGEAQTVRRHAHSLKGLAATFFATRPVELAQRLEDESDQRGLGSITDDRVAQLRSAFAHLAQDLTERLL